MLSVLQDNTERQSKIKELIHIQNEKLNWKKLQKRSKQKFWSLETIGNKVKNALGSNSRLDRVEEKDLEKSKTGHWKLSIQKKTKEVKEWTEGEESIHEPWETIKRNNLQLLKSQKGKSGSLFKILILENFPKLWRNLDIQVLEIHSSQKKIYSKTALDSQMAQR